MMRNVLVAIGLLFALAGPVLAAPATEEKATHSDGTLHFRVPLNAKGERDGAFTAFHPGGKKLKERATYDAGKLDGVRQTFDESGKVVLDEAWVAGRLVAPRSVKQIEAARAQILKDAAAHVQRSGRPSNPNAPSPEVLARALAKVNTYRYLAGVPHDVQLDNEQINLCQHGSELLVKIGRLTHNPSRPEGVSDEAIELGKAGCGRSNLFMGGDAVGSVDAYMNDSDRSNIDRLGHRRWVLNPAMAKTGFGGAGKFSAMYSFDASRAEVPDYDLVAWPPPGYCPTALFQPSWAWHVSVNSKKYKVTDKAALAIYPVDAKLRRAKEPLPLDYRNVNRDGFGIPNAIIARPKGFAHRPSAAYEVVVTGVETRDGGQPAEISYVVSFY